jgi:hypothetical protein
MLNLAIDFARNAASAKHLYIFLLESGLRASQVAD